MKYFLGQYVFFHPYALMSNHYHLSIKVREEAEINKEIDSMLLSERTKGQQAYILAAEKNEVISELIVSQFRRFHLSYSQAFNKM